MEFNDDKKNELQKKEEKIITEAMDHLFQSSAFGNLLNGFQNLINSSVKDVQTTIHVRERDTGLYVDIAIPATFRDGEIAVDSRSRYLHVTLQEKQKQQNEATFTSMTRTVQLPYEVHQEDMETSWNEQTMTLFFPKNKHE
ncbi:Hsp20/alpha crystallin family protein [Bacillus sp. C28GYM-DRY-1]|uniref:Hsp20/alpha crystallin family protein n=1 Tax=Bacillus sp. C28GYM-DRY-1 TaxID=3062686 RepID=UPI002676C0C1|nr:Hsp20/alpha crystallin family protein [Bacillus sp. C28GYM-DRY-1]MDO3662084.1 Hsp20/alpha crystallin family protein [Bacillus sp. C28GYM-DRY-1]